MTKGRAAVVALISAMDRNNNQPPQPGIYRDHEAPVVVRAPDGREMRNMCWGMPLPVFVACRHGQAGRRAAREGRRVRLRIPEFR
jgi:hypothetical protein